MAWCLPKYLTNDFLNKLRSGEINPEKLMSMTSDERRDFFDKNFGEEHGKDINVNFESKLLLKNQQQGIINWAKSMAGLKPEVQKDLISKVNKMTNVLNPENEKEFLKDYAGYKLGTNVTMDEAKNISSLAKIASETKAKMDSSVRREVGQTATPEELEHGAAKTAFVNYMNNLKNPSSSLKDAFVSKGKTPLGTVVKSVGRTIGTISDNSISLVSSMNIHSILKQGWKTIFSHPTVWAKNAINAVDVAIKTVGGKNVMDSFYTDLYSRPNFDLYGKADVVFGKQEEQFPGRNLLTKIPYLGRVFEASKNAFEINLWKTRIDMFDITKKWLEDTKGIEVTPQTVEELGLGKYVNHIGSTFKPEKSAATVQVANKFFWGTKMQVGNFNFLTANLFSKVAPEFKWRSAADLTKTIMGTAAIMTTASALGFNVDWKAGTIGWKDHHIDVSGGMKWMPIMAARFGKAIYNKTGLGKVTPDSYTQKLQGGDQKLIFNLFENRLTPAPSIAWDFLGPNKTRNGVDLTTFKGKEEEILGHSSPFTAQDLLEGIKSPDQMTAADAAAIIILASFGASTYTYTYGKPKKKASL